MTFWGINQPESSLDGYCGYYYYWSSYTALCSVEKTCFACSGSAPPTEEPTEIPTVMPTLNPSNKPSNEPSAEPTNMPTQEPSLRPTNLPTIEPSKVPTLIPIIPPTRQPTVTRYPSTIPTVMPTNEPSTFPSLIPTANPTIPTKNPSQNPSIHPSNVPSNLPTSLPTLIPTNIPSKIPSNLPTSLPTTIPTSIPSNIPTVATTIVIETSLETTNDDSNDSLSNGKDKNNEDSLFIMIVIICVSLFSCLLILMIGGYIFRRRLKLLMFTKNAKNIDISLEPPKMVGVASISDVDSDMAETNDADMIAIGEEFDNNNNNNNNIETAGGGMAVPVQSKTISMNSDVKEKNSNKKDMALNEGDNDLPQTGDVVPLHAPVTVSLNANENENENINANDKEQRKVAELINNEEIETLNKILGEKNVQIVNNMVNENQGNKNGNDLHNDTFDKMLGEN